MNSRLGIMIFDKDAKIVLELSSTASNQFQNEVRDALKTLNYRGSRSDLAGAVERAIYELRVQSRPDRRRAIVFVTDGVLDLGTESVTAAKTRWLRDDLGLEAKRSDVSIFDRRSEPGRRFPGCSNACSHNWRGILPSAITGTLHDCP